MFVNSVGNGHCLRQSAASMDGWEFVVNSVGNGRSSTLSKRKGDRTLCVCRGAGLYVSIALSRSQQLQVSCLSD